MFSERWFKISGKENLSEILLVSFSLEIFMQYINTSNSDAYE